jgi:hypothetical protein
MDYDNLAGAGDTAGPNRPDPGKAILAAAGAAAAGGHRAVRRGDTINEIARDLRVTPGRRQVNWRRGTDSPAGPG